MIIFHSFSKSKQYHNVFPNPFVIIRDFRPKPMLQMELGF
ncbi:hypothetical protein LEP1GSC125_2783 [Leptospira mayottensis 200901122]|uniref:Uncharacterized protein n=1 Tax=Leptospira mayottensis 200901122 TaxID=1193010 RepID=A0AA87MKN9_9LEPT|nr:hypothetical protein LEP1GSC125_2783 [Leptospira mayottensis 200901122]